MFTRNMLYPHLVGSLALLTFLNLCLALPDTPSVPEATNAFMPSQTKPNFTGKWKMDLAASKWEGGAPMSGTYKYFMLTLDHKDPQFITKQEFETSDARVLTYAVTTDGSEQKVKINDLPALAWAKWEGNSLKTYLKRDLSAAAAPQQRETIRTLTLSADGKTMTATVKVTLFPEGAAYPSIGNEVWIKQ